MQITVQTKGFELTKALKHITEDKVRLALTRFSQRISSIDIVLLDINGPRGGEDKRCKMKVKLIGQPELVVQQTEADLYEAINLCGSRVKRTVVRRLDKLRTSGRPIH